MGDCHPVASSIDRYVQEERERRHIPGISVAVVQQGKTVLTGGYGLANVELSVPATQDTVYEIGSVTKPLTATAIMMLVEQGKLSLDSRVDDHLSGLPPIWRDVTVRHLLTHTSGIPNFARDLPLLAWQQDTSPDQIIERVAGAALEFPPGRQWAYSNTGYTLLGLLIDKVSGKPYGEFLSQQIFRPLGMSGSRLNDVTEIVSNRASGYTWEQDTLRNCVYESRTWYYASGGVISTVADLARWEASLWSSGLLRPSTLEQMWSPARLDGGEMAGYGLGWFVGSEAGHRVVCHGGNKTGFSSMVMRFLDEGLTVVVLMNLDIGFDTAPLARGIARFFLSDQAPVWVT